jgi:3-hydroxyisobutyrate dehydrogenase-like beta-hydroxyacid dehydrogenase
LNRRPSDYDRRLNLKTIAIISPGNMGHAVGRLLGSRGFDVITALADRSPRTRGLAAQAGIRDLGAVQALVAEAELVLSILPPAAAVAAAEAVATAMTAAGVTPPYADCNAIAPATAARIAKLIQGAGAACIDAGIIGGPPANGAGPRFYTSGPAAHLLAPLQGGGLVVRDLGGAIGRASALKMCYAAVTKGTAALQFAQLAAASRLGVEEALAAELEESQGATYAALRRALPRLPAKAPRWVEEMRQIAATFESVGVPGHFHHGAAALYELLSATPFADEPEEAVDTSRSLETTVAALAEVCARQS